MCVDGSGSRWCKHAGRRINDALSIHISFDRNSENGGELKTFCCNNTGITLKLEIKVGSISVQILEFLPTIHMKHPLCYTLFKSDLNKIE